MSICCVLTICLFLICLQLVSRDIGYITLQYLGTLVSCFDLVSVKQVSKLVNR